MMSQDDLVAAAIHETWRALAAEQGWSMQAHLDQPYDALAEANKDDNRAAARRMAAVLATAGLALAPAETGEAAPADALEANMETLAEAEHNGWMAHRAATGWSYGTPRDDAAKRHPAMVPYADLPEKEKDKDRNNIRHYPAFAARAGLRITRA